MNGNANWGALGFLTKDKIAPKKATASNQNGSSESSDVELRIKKARELTNNASGYARAAELRVWLSKSKAGGVMPIERMDVAYMANILKMIQENRHPILKVGSAVGETWIAMFTDEIAKVKAERGEV